MVGRWIKLFEALLDDPMWQRLPGEQAKAWVGFMLQCNWTPREFFCRNCRKGVKVPAGATTKSYRTLAERAGVSPSIMKRLIKALEIDGFLINRSRPRCHALYVVRNWRKFQARVGRGDLALTPGDDPSLDPSLDPVSSKRKKKEDVEGSSSPKAKSHTPPISNSSESSFQDHPMEAPPSPPIAPAPREEPAHGEGFTDAEIADFESGRG